MVSMLSPRPLGTRPLDTGRRGQEMLRIGRNKHYESVVKENRNADPISKSFLDNRKGE